MSDCGENLNRSNPYVLFRNESSSVFLLDIPTSISAAQELDGIPRRRLQSCEPLTKPFDTPEPRSEAAVQKFRSRVQDDPHNATYVGIIEGALSEIRQHRGIEWCLPRHTPDSLKSRKRKLSEADLGGGAGDGSESSTVDDATGVDQMMKTLSVYADGPYGFEQHKRLKFVCVSAPTERSSPIEEYEDLYYLSQGIALHNEKAHARSVAITTADTPSGSFTFSIPPSAIGILSTCNDSSPLRVALRTLSDLELPPNRKYDLIVLDPPWPNRSARRKKSYGTGYNLRDARQLLYGMDLDVQLSADGFVAVWITNKRGVRDLVLGRDGEDGWFGTLGVELVEEWIWTKTTVKGECVSDLNGVWRKPYEVLLIGRRSGGSGVSGEAPPDVKRRVIAAVPDLHSRKPCLKSLFGSLLFGGKEYSALEVFARYMVAGWWSWGDEAIKYNCEGFWD